MKLKDFVAKNIWEYPSLFKDVDYEKSEIKVLCQVFFTCGNGMELAHTKDPKKGGYYVSPNNYMRNGEWVRKFDKPYGAEKFPELPADFFKYPIYYISQGFNGRDANESSYVVKHEDDTDRLYIRIEKPINLGEKKEKGIDRIFREPTLVEAESRYEWRPYPFSFEYSAFGDLANGGFLQPDWMDGLVRLSKAALSYYKDPERTKSESAHPSSTVPEAIQKFAKAASEGPESVVKLKKGYWGWGDTKSEPTSDVPTEAEIRKWGDDLFSDFINTRVRTIEAFLEKQLNEGETAI